MVPPFRLFARWLLILCFIGQGFAPFVAMAQTRIWSPDMAICYSGQTHTKDSSTQTLHHPCCCQIQQDTAVSHPPTTQHHSVDWRTFAAPPTGTLAIHKVIVTTTLARGPPNTIPLSEKQQSVSIEPIRVI